MAEAFARHHGRGDFEIFSAGSAPSGRVGPAAIASMSRRGLELGHHYSKSLDDLPPGRFDVAVTMGCSDACPGLDTDLRYDWDLADPRELPPMEFDAIRDEIESRVRRLLDSLE